MTIKERCPVTDGSFTMKLGNTTYAVEIYFSNTSSHPLEQKIKQMLYKEALQQHKLDGENS